MKEIKNRQLNIDLLRILACIMVIMIHVSVRYVINDPIASSSWTINVFFDAIARAAVPLFMMISGKLLLEKKEVPTVKEIFSKYIFKMLKIYIIWSLFYTIVSVLIAGMTEAITIDLIFRFIMPKLHLWYIAALITVYLLLPLFYAIRDYKEGIYLKYFVLLFFVFGILRTTILLLPFGINARLLYIPKFLKLINYPLVELSGYFLLGYYLAKNQKKEIKSKRLIAIFLLTFLFVGFATYFISVKKSEVYIELYNNFVIFTFIEAVCLFKLFLNLNLNKLSKSKQKLIINFSNLTFGIYLIHLFVLEITADLLSQRLSAVPFLRTILFCFLTLTISAIFVKIIKKTKFSNQIM